MGSSRDEYRTEQEPSDDLDTGGWDIMRADKDRPAMLICVSSRNEGVRTHWWKGRTTPCRKDKCEACAAGHQSRWNGYVAVVDIKDKSRRLFEYTPKAAVAFKEALKERGTLRGLKFIAERASKRDNAKVIVTIRGLFDEPHKLPAEPKLWDILSKIWQLNGKAQPRFSEFDEFSLSEHERVLNGLQQVGAVDENAWMRSRAQDLAGQLVLPLDPSRNGNGNEH